MKSFLWLLVSCGVLLGQAPLDILNQNRPILDAHNCYPYDGQWNDRLDRALSTGIPVGIEQDLAWAVDSKTGKGHVVVSHSRETTGSEPTLREHFFEHVRPMIEKALRDNDRARWPLVVVHFDVKDNRPELLHAVWDLLGEYEPWIATAVKGNDPRELAPIDMKPLLALTEDNDAQEQVFFTSLKPSDRLRLFGSAHTSMPTGKSREELTHLATTLAPEELLKEKPTNYRRWWNNSWAEVEEGSQSKAGDWTPADDARLRALVNHAHKQGFWIRFYTIDGFDPGEDKGWGEGYNFGSHAAAVTRWKASVAAGVNLIATDQFEDLAVTMRGTK
jgi:hypothetical protein